MTIHHIKLNFELIVVDNKKPGFQPGYNKFQPGITLSLATSLVPGVFLRYFTFQPLLKIFTHCVFLVLASHSRICAHFHALTS